MGRGCLKFSVEAYTFLFRTEVSTLAAPPHFRL